MRPVRRLGPAALVALLLGGLAPAQAQYYDDGYDGPPPPRVRVYRERVYDPPPPPRRMGLNCDAVQSGISGLQPYSCPLPGPRPLGARCFCDMPISFMNGPQTAVGRVSP